MLTTQNMKRADSPWLLSIIPRSRDRFHHVPPGHMQQQQSRPRPKQHALWCCLMNPTTLKQSETLWLLGHHHPKQASRSTLIWQDLLWFDSSPWQIVYLPFHFPSALVQQSGNCNTGGKCPKTIGTPQRRSVFARAVWASAGPERRKTSCPPDMC